MANSIELAKKYVPMLDEVYKKGSKTSILESPNVMVREGANVNEVLLPSITVQGLGEYTKDVGYGTSGDTNFSWDTYKLTQDRGRPLEMDRLDNNETMDLGVGAMTSTFIRSWVTPEIDAYRFAKMSSLAGNDVEADLTSATVLPAIDTALATLGDAEVSVEDGAYMFVSYNVYTAMKNADQLTFNFNTSGQDNISREVASYDGIPVIRVPQSRFYTEITLQDGATAGQEAGGFIKTAVTGRNINFMIVTANTVMPVVRLAQPKLHNPNDVVGKDSWIFEYRLYHDIIIPKNKVNGVYLHNATA